MHISDKSGKVLKNGAIAYDVSGKVYYHMLNVADVAARKRQTEKERKKV